MRSILPVLPSEDRKLNYIAKMLAFAYVKTNQEAISQMSDQLPSNWLFQIKAMISERVSSSTEANIYRDALKVASEMVQLLVNNLLEMVQPERGEAAQNIETNQFPDLFLTSTKNPETSFPKDVSDNLPRDRSLWFQARGNGLAGTSLASEVPNAGFDPKDEHMALILRQLEEQSKQLEKQSKQMAEQKEEIECLKKQNHGQTKAQGEDKPPPAESQDHAPKISPPPDKTRTQGDDNTPPAKSQPTSQRMLPNCLTITDRLNFYKAWGQFLLALFKVSLISKDFSNLIGFNN